MRVLDNKQIKRISIAPHSVGLSFARRKVSDAARCFAFNEDQLFEIQIAVGEALSNAFKHGSPSRATNIIKLECYAEDNYFTVSIKDEGPGFCFISKNHKTPRRGLGLIKFGMDKVDCSYDGGLKMVLKKRLRQIVIGNEAASDN